jgi:hypothetical protein
MRRWKRKEILMKNILLTLLVCGGFGVFAEELTFVCDDVNSSSDMPQSLLVNTKKSYLIFFKNKFDIYVNDETLIMSRHQDNESHEIVEIDKVSGWLKYFMIEPFDTSGVYKCTKQSRLMQ